LKLKSRKKQLKNQNNMSGIGYTYQDRITLIGSKSGTTRTSVALTTAYQAEATGKPTKSFSTGGLSKINLGILYTTGAGETSNSIEIKVETSADGTNFYQIPNESVSGGTSTITQREFTFVGAAAATAYEFSLPLDIQDEYMKVSVKESGVASNAGTIFMEATLCGAK
jgi:hypothetical protein